MKAQRQIVARRQQRVHAGGQVRQQPGELTESLRRVQLVQIIDDQHDVAAGLASSASTLSTIAGALKSGVAAGAAAPLGAPQT